MIREFSELEWLFDEEKLSASEKVAYILKDVFEENKIPEEERIPIFWGRASNDSFMESIRTIGCDTPLKNPYRNGISYLTAFTAKKDLTRGSTYIFTVSQGKLSKEAELFSLKKKWLFEGNSNSDLEILQYIVDHDCIPEYNNDVLRKKIHELQWPEAFREFNEKRTSVQELSQQEAALNEQIQEKEQEKATLEKQIREYDEKVTKEATEYNELLAMRIDAAKKLKQIRGLTAFFAQGGKKNQIKTTAIQFSESDNPFAAFKSRLDYEYKDEMLVPFFIALSTTQIITLFGKPGTGKTTFVSKTAKALGAKCTIISVQNNWTDSSDLLGYYNPLKGTYESTNFVEALIDAYYDWIQYSVESPLHIICLDEMNLARMEYYFAEFLSLMQRESNERIVRLLPVYLQDEILSLFPNDEEKNIEEEREAILKDPEKRKKHKLGRYLEFAIPPNVRFVGTINNDDTTNPLSPKVRDRCFFLELTTDNYSTDKQLDRFQDHFPVSLFDLQESKDIEEFKNENARFNTYAKKMWPLFRTIKPRGTKKEFCQYLIIAKVLPLLQYRDDYASRYSEEDYPAAWELFESHSSTSGEYYDYLGG